MRVVIDTNVLVSAVLRDREPEEAVQYVVVTPGVEWLATPPIIEEYRSVLRRPCVGLSKELLEEWDQLIAAAVLVVDAVPPVSWTGDPGDAMFVACAAGVGADFLVTGDRGLLSSGRLGATLVLTVSQFMRLVRDRSGS